MEFCVVTKRLRISHELQSVALGLRPCLSPRSICMRLEKGSSQIIVPMSLYPPWKDIHMLAFMATSILSAG
ncbi:hypothetical protein SCLCIDRAFT_479137 [Scleroderma citrinum Foug A]|uniref:Uncharacterized protein n=1 Tax=Scleroderma citrinum Foug A TaxID=1036808 RepID=A0A0C2ZJL0_9AGAM|nr:hypothetical protein SCLCIDRAFT_479137 [Scleroderma citrinum Foug A]